MAGEWKKFGAEPLVGIFWVCGTYPKFEVDVDNDGRTVGCPTGETKEFVALVEIDFDPGPDGGFEVSPINEYATGDYDDTYGITHYMPFKKPAGPSLSADSPAPDPQEGEDYPPCMICGGPNDMGELCPKCAKGNNPFVGCDNCGSDLKRQ